MRKLLYCLIMVFAVSIVSCSTTSKEKRRFVSKDSTLVFTFIGDDSLYIDAYGSGCNVAEYALDAEIITFSGERVYEAKGYNADGGKDYCSIRLSPNPIGNHWDYFIKIGNDILEIVKDETRIRGSCN